MQALVSKALVRAALVGSALIDRRRFWAQAALGRNQLKMHDFGDGEISIGRVSEQLFAEGFIRAHHEVLERELGPERASELLREIGTRGASWEIHEAIRHQIWVPRFLRPLVGRPELFARVRSSRVLRTLVQETMRIVFHMIMTEGGWGVIRDIDIASDPMYIRVRNTPEHRQLGPAEAPTCDIMTGIYRAYFQEVFGIDCDAREATCQSVGAPHCTFEFSNPRPRES
jgi:predicted hydrocarbon binding protein